MTDFESHERLRWRLTDFKAYLVSRPDHEELEIVRDEATAPVVDFR